MKISSCFKPLYIHAESLGPGLHRRVILSVEEEYVNDGDSQALPVVRFENQENGLILNATNAWALAEAYGDETDEWIGKPVILRAVWSSLPWVKVDPDPALPGKRRRKGQRTRKRQQ